MANTSTPYQTLVQAVSTYHHEMFELRNRLANTGNWFTRLFVKQSVLKRRRDTVKNYFDTALLFIGIALCMDSDEIAQSCLDVSAVTTDSKLEYTLLNDPAIPLGIQSRVAKANLKFIEAVREYTRFQLIDYKSINALAKQV